MREWAKSIERMSTKMGGCAESRSRHTVPLGRKSVPRRRRSELARAAFRIFRPVHDTVPD